MEICENLVQKIIALQYYFINKVIFYSVYKKLERNLKYEIKD